MASKPKGPGPLPLCSISLQGGTGCSMAEAVVGRSQAEVASEKVAAAEVAVPAASRCPEIASSNNFYSLVRKR